LQSKEFSRLPRKYSHEQNAVKDMDDKKSDGQRKQNNAKPARKNQSFISEERLKISGINCTRKHEDDTGYDTTD